MGAYEGLNAVFNGGLCDYAVQYGYDNLLFCQHHSDKRTPFQYGQELEEKSITYNPYGYS